MAPSLHATRLVQDRALVHFLNGWQRRLACLQRSHPARFRVRGLSDEETRDQLLLGLLEAAKSDPSVIERHDAAFGRVKLELSALRKRFRLPVTPVDFLDGVPAERAPTQEERLSQLQTDEAQARAAAQAEATLSRPQKKWLAAMKLAAEDGAFFAASDALNLAHAARVRGLHRSSAQRAYVSLCAHFSRHFPAAK